MNRILIDARESRTTTGRYIDKLIENIGKINKVAYRFDLLTKPGRSGFLKDKIPNSFIVLSDVKEFSIDEQTRLNKQISKTGADLVHFGMAQQPIRYKGDVITTIHDLTTLRFNNPDKNYLVFKFKQYVYGKVIKIAVNKSKYVITPSEYVKKDLINYTGVSGNKIKVTHEAADFIESDAKQFSKLVNKDFIMYIGRPTPHKNLKRLIEAHQLLLKDNPELYLSLSGKIDNNYLRIKKWVNKKKFNKIIFTDFLEDSELKWMYQNTRAYVFPSLSEGFGLPGLEAMVHGAPVVSSDATCLPEIYGDAASYFNPLDVSDMYEKINKVINDQEFRERLIKKGYIQSKKYSWEKMARETLDIYKMALK
jgi:glycosyltransferase involved in cell wall biosynthesis